MYNFSYSNPNQIAAYIFFPFMVIFGSFFTLNLILAQVLDAFHHQHKQADQKKVILEEREQIKRNFE